MFESRFESGNLFSVFKVTENEYDLIVQNDINSKGNNQWFYFYVMNTKKDHEVKFNLVNLAKKKSLFNYGTKVVAFSETAYQKQRKRWFWCGTDIQYYKNNIVKVNPLRPLDSPL